MAKNEVTILAVERSGCRLLRQARGGPAAAWATSLRRGFPVAADGDNGTDAAHDPLAGAFAAAAAMADGGAVLAMPTSRLLVKLLRLPPAAREDLADVVPLQMARHAPFSGDEMTVAGEIIHETPEELTVFAAVLPRAAVELLSPWVNAARLRVERVDALMLGWWPEARTAAAPSGRRIFLAEAAGELDLIVADGGRPLLCRGLGEVGEAQALAREAMVSLLNVEIECGHGELAEVVFFGDNAPDSSLAVALRDTLGAPLRHVRPAQPDVALAGLVRRAAEMDAATINLLPAAWRAGNAAAAAARRFWRVAAVFAALWLMAALVLFGAPFIAGRRVRMVERALAAQKNAFEEVQNMRRRITLIESYMDRSGSVLEAMRVAAERMPEGLNFTALNYRREEGLRLTGEATDPALVYQLKDGLENTPPFAACTLTGVSLAADRRMHRFELVCALNRAEGEAP